MDYIMCIFTYTYVCLCMYGGGGHLVAKLCLTLVTPWTVAHQAPLSMGLPRQEYWSGLPFPPPGDLPNPGIKPRSRAAPASPALQVDSLPTEPPGKPFCTYTYTYVMCVFTYAHMFMYIYIYASVHTFIFHAYTYVLS